MAGKLDGKVALITGAAQGIGAASAIRLAAEGAVVVVADILDAGAQETVNTIIAAGGKASTVRLDVTQEAQWEEVIAGIKTDHGKLHILMNNAGIGRPAPLIETDLAMFRLLFSVNVEGMFLGMKHAIPLIQQSGGGSIINLSSAASIKVSASMSAYCASKAAIAHLTKAAALECAQGKTNVRVNSIHPGPVITPAWDHLGAIDGGDPGSALDPAEMAAAIVPMGFAAIPEDIANAVLFLASDESRYMTGAEMVIDGGQTIA